MRIRMRGVVKRYGEHAVLRGVDLDIADGDRIALVGPNGSGKSTLLRIVMGLLTFEGEVAIDGRDPFRHRNELAHRVAYVPQVAPNLGTTVIELIRAIADLRAIAEERVAKVAHRLSLDVDAVRGRSFRALSGGMKHKLLIALALATDASLFILDEPTASLDEASRGVFADLLAHVPKEATVLLCSHRTDDICQLAQRTVRLVEGRVVFDGPVVPESSATLEGV